jgi:hypothetical protein
MSDSWYSKTLTKEQVDKQRRDFKRDAYFPNEGSEEYLASNWLAEYVTDDAVSSLPVFIRAADQEPVVRIDGEWHLAEQATVGHQAFLRFRELPSKQQVKEEENEEAYDG